MTVAFQDTKQKKKRSHDFENLELVMSRGFVSAGGTN